MKTQENRRLSKELDIYLTRGMIWILFMII